MWPFNRKPKEPKPPSWRQLAVDELRAWRKIGDTFSYLGRTCVVTGYCQYYFHELGSHVYVKLSADYADDLGHIRHISFDWSEAQAVMRNNP
jgi:hypothetical protein